MERNRKTCSIDACERKHNSHGVCSLHYQRMRRDGSEKVKRNTATIASVRDSQGRKQCKACGEWLNVYSFTKNNAYADRLERLCRECKKPKQKVGNLGRMGLTPPQFESMINRQGHVCAICKREPDKWNIDHDHKCCQGSKRAKLCGKCVRGLLCQRCNHLLGNCQDSIDVLHEAISYLREWNGGEDSNARHRNSTGHC